MAGRSNGRAAPLRLPAAVRALLEGAELARVRHGESGDEVWRAELPEGGVRYLKQASGWRRAELRREHDVLRWLAGRAGAPRALHFDEDAVQARLVLEGVPGRHAAELAAEGQPKVLVPVLAEALRAVHAIAVEDCPFHRRVADMVHEAWRRARAGLVQLDQLDAERRGRSVEELVRELEASVPPEEDLVFVHGDFCFPNILLLETGPVRRTHRGKRRPSGGGGEGLRLGGLVDWGRAGIADRYQDIALLLRSFERNAPPALRVDFARAYGLDALDDEKLAFYTLLDEFF